MLCDPLDLGLLEPERPRRIRRHEYDQMVAAGLFADERIVSMLTKMARR